jgi:hypothetical protein
MERGGVIYVMLVLSWSVTSVQYYSPLLFFSYLDSMFSVINAKPTKCDQVNRIGYLLFFCMIK